MPKKRKKTEVNKGAAFVTTFFSILGFIIALLAWRKDKYVMFYATQSLVVFVAWVILSIIASIFVWIPVVGWIVSFAAWLLILLLWIFSWAYALTGEQKEVPIVGSFGRKIKF